MSETNMALLPLVLRVLRAQQSQTPIRAASFFGLPLGLSGGDLVVLPAGLEAILQLIHDEVGPDMGLAENARTRALTSDEDGNSRRFHTALFAGARTVTVGATTATVLGIGFRRWTRVWPQAAHQSEALQADIEFYLPCAVITDDGAPFEREADLPRHVRLLEIGIAVTRGGRGLVAELDAAGLRFAAACPILGKVSDLFTISGSPVRLGDPVVVAEKRAHGKHAWEATDTWHKDLTTLVGDDEGKALLEAPVGPVTATNVNSTMLLELIRTAGDPERESFVTSAEKAKAWRTALKERWAIIKSDAQEEEEEEEKEDESTPDLRSLGDVLVSAGIMTEAGGKNKLKKKDDITALSFFQVLRAVVADVDGMSVIASGFNKEDGWRGAVQLAASPDPHDPTRTAFGARILAQDLFLRRAAKKLEDEEAEDARQKKRDVEVRLHFGRWFNAETMEDNWVRRLMPHGDDDPPMKPWLPGIAVYPLSLRVADNDAGGGTAALTAAMRGEIVSAGVDILGTTKAGLVSAGPFKMAGVQLRGLLSLQTGREAGLEAIGGVGVKLTGIALDFSPKKKKEEELPFEQDLLATLRGLTGDEGDEAPPEPEEEELKHGTRRDDEKYFGKTFSFSFGYRTPDIIDVQLYDAKDRPGKAVWIEVGRHKSKTIGTVETSFFFKNIGLQLAGWENLSLSALAERLKTPRKEDDEAEGPRVGVRISGGLRIGPVEVALIGAGVTVTIDNPVAVAFELDGVDLSVLAPPVRIFGSFLRDGTELAGAVCIETPALSITAVGAIGCVTDKEDVEENGVTRTITTTVATGFLYGAISAGRGGGLRLGIIRFTGLALGFGVNRELTVPGVDGIADFSLVKLVMGEGGLQKPEKGKSFTDMRQHLAAPPAPPYKILEAMKKEVVAKRGSWFACAGLRFTIAEAVDCFALAVVSKGGDGLTIALLGLARMRLPRAIEGQPDPKPVCYIELQLLAALKPDEGLFQFEAALTSNSWVIDKSCQLTGGFALRIWFGGDHRGDWVFSIGGYHPRFARPAHYPIVPRLALRWQVTEHLVIKGSLYFAVTPACIMLGLFFEAVFRTSRLYVCFTAHLDLLFEYEPFHYEIDAGITIRAEADLALFTLKITVGARLQMWGPEAGGIVTADLGLVSVDIPFGEKRRPTPLLKSWDDFESRFLDPAVCQPSLLGGRVPQARDEDWVVRADELRLGLTTAVPATELRVGTVVTQSPPRGVMPLDEAGIPRTVSTPVAVNASGGAVRKGAKVGVRPMRRRLDSTVNVTVVRDTTDGAQPVELSDWVFEEQRGPMASALWDPDTSTGPIEPSAKLIPDCITGLQSLRPPVGQIVGTGTRPFSIDELDPLPLAPRAAARVAAFVPPDTGGAQAGVDLQADLATSRDRRAAIAAALGGLAFAVPEPTATPRFRRLRGRPSLGAVARSA